MRPDARGAPGRAARVPRVSGDAAETERIDRPTMLALGALALAVFVVANDITALSVALPPIEKDFDTDVSTVQWVVNAYALVFGVLIVTGGRLADLYGRRRIFFVGAAIFTVFSLLGGAAQDVGWLIACRALMGIGGAFMWPAILGMTYDVLPDSRAGLAGGLIIGAAGLGNAAGPLIGGVLTDIGTWRWILYLNLPIALIACAGALYAVKESSSAEPDAGLDRAGVATLSISIVALLLALDLGAEWGLGDARTLGLVAVSIVLFVVFIAVERRMGAAALVPSDVMGTPAFRHACLAVLLMSPTFFAALFYLPQFMQKILDRSPLGAGAGLLPMMGVFAVVSFGAGPLYERFGMRRVTTAGASCLFLGMVLLSLVGHNAGYGALVPGMVVLGVGIGLFYSSITTAAVTALDPSRASLAGGITYMFQVAGGSVGLGLTTAAFTAGSRNSLTDKLQTIGVALDEGERNVVHGILAGTDSAQQVLSRFDAGVADRIVGLVRDAFVGGMQWGFRLDALLAFGGLLVTWFLLGRDAPAAESAPEPAAERAPDAPAAEVVGS